VLYFAARLRLPVQPEAPMIGAPREGLTEVEEGQPPPERSFRTALGSDGWSPPELVELGGVDEARVARVTWVSEDETVCLVTVENPGEPPWVGRAERGSVGAAWGDVERLEALAEGDAADGVYLAGSDTMIAFASRRVGVTQRDIFMYDPQNPETPAPLDQRISTTADEWGCRVGPQNELFFCRGDRQLVLAGGSMQPLRLPGPHRAILTAAAPTADGAWVFFCQPRLTPVELDQDIYVAPWSAEEGLGEAVPVDDWRPE
jgi:hypothetical protein